MSKGTFKVTVKSANLSSLQETFEDIHPYVQVIFGDQVKKTASNSEGGFTPSWNEQFTFKKNLEYRLGLAVSTKNNEGKDFMLGMQEIGINTFVKKMNTVDHKVELLKNGVVIGDVLLNIEFIPDQTQEKKWQVSNLKKKGAGVHKLLISKMKATLEANDSHEGNQIQSQYNPCLKVTVGRRLWITQESPVPGSNLQWTDSFKIVIENEQEVCLELIQNDDDKREHKLGSAILKLKQFKQGSSPNKVPITFEGTQIGFFYFQSDYQIPQTQNIASVPKESTPQAPISQRIPRMGILIVNMIRLYLDKANLAEDGFIQLLWSGQLEKTQVIKGITNKLEWKDPIIFKKPSLEIKLEVKLLDKHQNSEDDPFGYGFFLLEPAFLDGGKFRSQKIDIFAEELPIGQIYIDYEYVVEQGVFSEARYDPFDMKKQTLPTEELIKKKELISKRKDLMKSSLINQEKNKSFLPLLEESSTFKTNQSVFSTPQPKQAVKSIHSLSLPTINYDIKIKEYSKIYKDSVFGLGMSNVHSSASLRHSVPAFSLPKADRFPSSKYSGHESLNYQPPSNFGKNQDIYAYQKKKMYSADQRYQIFHRSPAQKTGPSFGVGDRFKIFEKRNSAGFYQAPQLLNYND